MIIADTVREARSFLNEIWNIPVTEIGEVSIEDRNVLELYTTAHKSNNPDYPFNVNMLLDNDMVRRGPLNHSLIVEDEEFFAIVLYSLHPTTLEVDNILELTSEDEPEEYHEIFPVYSSGTITL